MSSLPKILPALTATCALAALTLAGCSDPDGASKSGPSSEGSDTSQSDMSQMGTRDVMPYDMSEIPTVDEIAALVPDAVKERGVLRNGASTDYAPAEYRASDGQTPVGYDVDITMALAKVMGLKEGTTKHAEFPTIIPALGTKFDIGMSSFTITAEREKQTTMISYVEVGSAFAVAKGNPKNFDPTNICGTTIGVQNGTFQQEYVQKISESCVADGNKAIAVMPHDVQTDITTKVIGGQYDATFADSTVIGYTVELAKGQLEQVGDVIESAPQGIALNKDDAQLAQAVQKAMQYLMDEGYLTKLLAPYGAENAALDTAEMNPAV
ncbi:ABC transporter substrate-binding protein [Schaalia sp. ZJ1691]|uniref:ABC transporter substrate-binding protein n=1 Tax=Schaalia sp. ZJ1691 TaxID=2709404 RepID=UPI0013EC76E2|nr:ABC transporter substrate-binding protein [Schaalia sp. ZJ1691]